MRERWFADDGKLIQHRVFDAEPAMEAARALKDNTHVPIDESWHIARVPMAMVTIWLKEAGVRWDDHQAVEEVLTRKLLDGEFSKFRVKEGTF